LRDYAGAQREAGVTTLQGILAVGLIFSVGWLVFLSAVTVRVPDWKGTRLGEAPAPRGDEAAHELRVLLNRLGGCGLAASLDDEGYESQ